MRVKVQLTCKMEWSRLRHHIMQRCRCALTQQCLTAWQVPLTGSQVQSSPTWSHNQFRCNSTAIRHTHTIVLLLFWNLSGTTQVSRYQKGKTRKDSLQQERQWVAGIKIKCNSTKMRLLEVRWVSVARKISCAAILAIVAFVVRHCLLNLAIVNLSMLSSAVLSVLTLLVPSTWQQTCLVGRQLGIYCAHTTVLGCIARNASFMAAVGTLKALSLSSVFCYRAGSGYPNGYPALGNSRGGFPVPSSRFVITHCDQSFPSPWHCLSAAPSLSDATLLSTLEGIPLSTTRGCGWLS